MCCNKHENKTSHEYLNSVSPEEIMELKAQLLFRYLYDVQELNKRLRTLVIAEEIAQIDRERDKALHQVLLTYGKREGSLCLEK